MVTSNARPSLAGLLAEVHRLVTGRAITIAEARKYFRHPETLANVVRQSGLLNDPPRRRRLQQLLDTEERKELANGF